jgi:hypothetical protein
MVAAVPPLGGPKWRTTVPTVGYGALGVGQVAALWKRHQQIMGKDAAIFVAPVARAPTAAGQASGHGAIKGPRSTPVCPPETIVTRLTPRARAR